ncbi:FG-GAP repeat protein [Micromonospora sp. CPCC 205539]|uniref:FG-GAP repeat protein n=1 Tax=Micromonospora sp. CPCC 205539 TaxID=3122408 RepID=UPI002FF36E37
MTEARKVAGEYRGAVHVLPGAATGGFTNLGSQYFDHATPGMPTDDGSPDRHSKINDFGSALASGDFDHDGFDDLAIGSVHDRFRILYGGPSGLSTAEARMFRLADVAPADDVPGEGVVGENLFGYSFTVGDFDGDGTDDLVAGASRAGLDWAGGVAVFRGTPGGLNAGAAQWIRGDAPGLPITAETDGFGAVLASADFDSDGRDDLAIGFDRDGLGEKSFAGSVVILPGAAGGVSIAASRVFTQDTPGVPDAPEWYDGFGHALAAGDLTGDGYADLVVTARSEGLNSTAGNRGGSLTVLRGSPGGLTVGGAQYWTQQTPGVPGSDDPAVLFGWVLAFADFDRDGRGDVAVASPEEVVGGVEGAGAITIFRGNSEGLTTTGLRRLDAATPGLPTNLRTQYSYFGSVLHTVRQPDGAASLVVGFTSATVADLQRAGMVLVLPSTSDEFGRRAITGSGLTTWSGVNLPAGPQAFGTLGIALS